MYTDKVWEAIFTPTNTVRVTRRLLGGICTRRVAYLKVGDMRGLRS